MKPEKPLFRFLLGAGIALLVAILGFAWVATIIPTWGSTPEEITRSFPSDDQVLAPSLTWNHALTIHAPADKVYPWLVQIGDSRAAFYSITFIENAFCMTSGACRYVNANKIHPEWQNPVKGEQGIIVDVMVVKDYQPGQSVLAAATNKLPLKWTWLWYVEPVDAGASRLIVRHRIAFPPDAPKGIINAVFTSGYVMERGMLLGIKARAESSLPSPLEEPLGAIIWLLVAAGGIAAAVRFVRVADGYPTLGVGLAAIVILFILTFIQPPLWVRFGLLLLLTAGIVVTFRRKQIHPVIAPKPV